MSRDNKTADERQHLKDVKSLGCIACRMEGYIALGDCNAIAHHMTSGKGMGEMRDDFETFPLCYEHHSGTTISVHGTPELFQITFGKEADLVAQTLKDLETYRASFVGRTG